MPELTMNATTRVKTLIALTEELSSIFEQENALLTARRPREITRFEEDKSRLAVAYAQSIREVAADRGVVNGASDALMEKLKELTAVFQTRASTQRALLDGARIATEGVLKAVAEEAGAARDAHSYASPSPNRPSTTAAISVNEKI